MLGHILRHESQRDDIQTGGGIVSGNSVRYDYRTGRNALGVSVFYGGRTKGKKECFLLLLNPDKTADIQWLENAADCALDPNGSGKSMVRAVLNLARQRGARSIALMDTSKKTLANNKGFRLSNMYFLTTGQTWYESLIPGLYPQEKEDKVALWRQKVQTNTWEDVHRQLGDISIPVDISDIDASQPGSAMIVLRRIKEAGGDFFAEHEDDLLLASGIGNLHGLSWEAPL